MHILYRVKVKTKKFAVMLVTTKRKYFGVSYQYQYLLILCKTMGKLKQIAIQNSPRMPYMQHFCHNGIMKCVQFGFKVEFTKLRTKTCYVCFFKDSLNKRAGTPTLELDEGNISPFAKFEYERSSSKT